MDVADGQTEILKPLHLSVWAKQKEEKNQLKSFFFLAFKTRVSTSY